MPAVPDDATNLNTAASVPPTLPVQVTRSTRRSSPEPEATSSRVQPGIDSNE